MNLRSTALALLIAVAGASASNANAQQVGVQAPSTKGVVPKNRAPVSDSILRVRLPRPQEADLANGIRLMVLEDRRAPQITFTLLVPGAGGYFDPTQLPGLATVTAAMMREGTAERTSAQISEQLETMAATLTVSTGMSSLDAAVSGSSLTEYFERLLDLTADVLLQPAFADEELARYKERTRAQLVQQRTNPGFLASERMSKVLYRDHPAGRVGLTVETLGQMTRAQLAEFHRTHYVPDHAAIAIAGDISFANAKALIEQKFGGWRRSGSARPRAADPALPDAASIYLVHRPTSVQTSLRVSTPAIERTSPDYDVLQVMNKIIGGGPTGRLFLHLREDKGYTYGAYSGLSAGRFRGDWTAFTDVRSEVTEPALRDLLAEITLLRDQPVLQKEFREQQRSLVAAFALSLESPQQMLGYYTTSWTYSLPADYWDRYPERIMAVTPGQVQDAARKYLDAGKVQIVAVGDTSRIASVLRGFGQVQMYDAEGRPIGATR